MQFVPICYPLWLHLAAVSVRGVHCVGCGSVWWKQFSNFLKKIRHLTSVIIDVANLVLRFIQKENVKCCVKKEKKNYSHEALKHACGWPNHGHVPSFSKQCSLRMRVFQTEFRVKLPLHITIILYRKQVPINVRMYSHNVYGLFWHTICF